MRVDLDDLALGDGESHHRERPSADGDDHPGRPVDQGGSHDARPGWQTAGLAGDGRRATDHHRGGGAPGAEVGSQHDVGIEQRDEGVEVAPARGREEGVDHLSLTSEIGVGSRYARRP